MIRFLLSVFDWFCSFAEYLVDLTQSYSYEVVVKNTAQSVIVPLKNCISSLDRVYEALVATDVHPFTGHCSNYEYIRQQIVQAWQSMQLSDQAATTCLRRLDEALETLTRDKGTLTRQKNTTECTLNSLRTEQDSNEKLLQKSQEALQQAETNLNSTKEMIQRQERREETASRVARVGLAVTLIPFIGWVVGPALMIGSVIEMNEASKALKIAEEELQKFKKQVETYTSKVSDHKFKIVQTDRNIRKMDQKLKRILNQIDMLKKQRRSLAELQLKVRRSVHVLSILSGQVNVLEQHTRVYIVYEYVLQVMEEVMQTAEEITGNKLLCDTEVLRLVGKMRQNNRHLRAICASRNNAGAENFLNYM
ncbi:hypothetical protein KOW79_012587 [Hemibagrus wyckioides]|uniref:Uncharacterized protein n=1 Tax=Hemibagrus wyckioides TaxID=337641 RepID=A0A9D3NL51_9TELE|nr:uncharacterized protein LOC131364654 isoform X2 [Hemibagrus wyckioides]KAG7324571.1 hypothetical protein KOW79_012587 [Hemibagrus wyckioides]